MVSTRVNPPAVRLHGRRGECDTLDRLLDGARAGQSGVLVLSGEAGVGKTALLEYAIESASDLNVLRTAGVQSEMELAFAALHQFCAPLLGSLDRLPVPQGDALRTTFGLETGAVPDRFFVGLAVLGLLSDTADQGPVLCVVDDAQWLDRASAETFAFVARRLLAESVVMLFATRGRWEVTAGLPELALEGLADADACELLASVVPGRLDERVAARLVAETQGNPLALLELPRGLSTSELAGGFGVPGALSVQGRIEERFRQRLELMPRDTQKLLLLAAAEPVGDPALLRRAAQELGIPEAAAGAAEAEGLLRLDGAVVFRHPLMRSAIYGWADPHERREVHRVLAEATDPQIDPDRRAWHHAQAASLPDEEVAAELERSAARAQARGGYAAAAAFLERATVLTPQESHRSRRALAAADAKVEIGALDDARRLLATAESGPLNELGQARAVLLRGRISFLAARSTDAAAVLLEAAERFRQLDPELARETYVEALTAAIHAGRLAGPGASVREVAEAAMAAPRALTPRGPDLLLDGLAAVCSDSYAAAVPILREAQRAIVSGMSQTEQLRWMYGATLSTLLLWDDEAWERLAEEHLRLVRKTGALGELPDALGHRGQMHLFSGQLAAAASLQDTLQEATELTGNPIAPYLGVSVLAMRGREADARRLIDRARSELIARGEGAGLEFMDWAESVLYNGLGRYDEALAAALRVLDHAELVPVNWAIPELIEAAVRVGTPELAFEADRRLADRTRASGTDWALGIAARAHALLLDEGPAESKYREAIERLGNTRMAVDLARTHLLYGEWLRRQQRRVDARKELRTAYEMFSEFGMEAFADRARVELLATGEHARKRTNETRDDLTPQEAEIARLARDGLSNSEIGARLFISKHTVEYHLTKVYAKLGITSRIKLAEALPRESSDPLLP
jgi:DNA-binding CsgD family transcriptional regulator